MEDGQEEEEEASTLYASGTVHSSAVGASAFFSPMGQQIGGAEAEGRLGSPLPPVEGAQSPPSPSYLTGPMSLAGRRSGGELATAASVVSPGPPVANSAGMRISLDPHGAAGQWGSPVGLQTVVESKVETTPRPADDTQAQRSGTNLAEPTADAARHAGARTAVASDAGRLISGRAAAVPLSSSGASSAGVSHLQAVPHPTADNPRDHAPQHMDRNK